MKAAEEYLCLAFKTTDRFTMAERKAENARFTKEVVYVYRSIDTYCNTVDHQRITEIV